MANVFGTTQNLAGAMRADGAKLLLNGAVVGLAQQGQFNFSQRVSMLFEIGSNNVYYVGGRAQGTVTINRVVGPAVIAGDLISTLGDICSDRPTVTLSAAGCQNGSGRTYRMEGCILTTISGTVTAQEVVINESFQLMFINLDIS